LIENEKEKEKKMWMQHIEKISKVGPRNIQILNSYSGEMEVGDIL